MLQVYSSQLSMPNDSNRLIVPTSSHAVAAKYAAAVERSLEGDVVVARTEKAMVLRVVSWEHQPHGNQDLDDPLEEAEASSSSSAGSEPSETPLRERASRRAGHPLSANISAARALRWVKSNGICSGWAWEGALFSSTTSSRCCAMMLIFLASASLAFLELGVVVGVEVSSEVLPRLLGVLVLFLVLPFSAASLSLRASLLIVSEIR